MKIQKNHTKKQDTLAEFPSFQKISLTAKQPKLFSNVGYRETVVYRTGTSSQLYHIVISG